MKQSYLFFVLTFLFVTLTTFAQTTAIPDQNFEQALIDLGIDSDGVVNGQVLTSDISGVTSLDLSSKNISNLSGVMEFSNLEHLNLNENNIDSLIIYDNKLKTLDASNNYNLKYIKVNNNQLTKLELNFNFPENHSITYIDCSHNQLTKLDLPGAWKPEQYESDPLVYLDCSYNQLSFLSVVNNFNIENLFCSNNSITSIYLPSDVNPGFGSWRIAGPSNLDCSNNLLTGLSLSGMNYHRGIQSINISNNKLTYIYLPYDFFDNFQMYYASLSYLNTFGNPELNCIDATKNSNLGSIITEETTVVIRQEGEECNPSVNLSVDQDIIDENGGESIITVSLSQPFALETTVTLGLSGTAIKDTDYTIGSNVITIPPGQTSASTKVTAISDFTGRHRTIIVDITEVTNGHEKTEQQVTVTIKNSNAPVTYIPDQNFEQALIDLGIDSDGIINGKVFTFDISDITQLDINDKNISDLTGIEGFTSLKTLWCYSNQLTSLDLSNNINLKTLWCYSNQLTSLDLSNNINLTYLECEINQLTNLDLSNNINLKTLWCPSNQLTSLDLSNNTNLEELLCESNQLTNLDLSNNTALQLLVCERNQLTNLDLSNNTALFFLSCIDNQLTNLDLSDNTALRSLHCYGNLY